jgi:hypothetical protein
MNIRQKLTLGVVLMTGLASGVPAMAEPPANRAALVGTWVNVNPATKGIVKVIITNDLFGFRVHTYGACSPTPCDHGTIKASPFSKSVSSTVAAGLSAVYNFGFKTTLITAKRTAEFDNGTFLELESRNVFAAGDTRFDYMQSELFRKQ